MLNKFSLIKTNTVYFMLGVLLFFTVLFSSLGLLIFYQFQSARFQETSLQKSQDKAERIADGLEDYLSIAVQLSRSITSLVAPLRDDKTAVEILLRRMLESAPAEMIYGIGAWYEPHVFDKTIEFFGPYAHRGSGPDTAAVLTYEWCTPEYNFPQHAWYLAGKQARGKTAFTEPYFDTNLVYMTVSRAFYDTDGAFVGVTSVDMVLPLLQKFVKQYNNSAHEAVYVVTAQGHLLVHPQEKALLAHARAQGRKPVSILDLQEKDLQVFLQAQAAPAQMRVAALVEDVNWQVFIATDEQQALDKMTDLRNNLLWIAGLIWLLLGFFLVLLIQAHKARARHHRLKEKLKKQMQKQQLLQEVNEALESKVKQRTAELETANQQISRLNEQLQAENLRMGAELDITHRLQQMVLPKPEELTRIPNLDIAGFMQPATEIGGDYYDVLLHQDKVKISIGDVTGHGLESGVLMLMVQMAVRTLLANNVSDPQVFLQALNRALYDNVQRMRSDKNLTLALLDYHQGEITVSGQHEEVLIARKNGQVESLDTLNLGFMVGLVDNISNLLGQAHISLEHGDGVVLYTDGITEAQNQSGEMYGLERLKAAIAAHWHKADARQIQQAVIADFRAYVEEAIIQDDITLVVLRRI